MRNSRKRKRSNDDSFTNNNRDFKEDSDRRKRRRVDGDGVRDDKREKNPRKRRREWRFSRAPSLMSITVPSEKEPEEKVELKIKKRRRKRQKHLHQEAVLQITRALFSDPPTIGHLFERVDEEGTPMALFGEVVTALKLSPALLTASEKVLSQIFDDSGLFWLEKESQAAEDEWFLKHLLPSWSVQESTVYMDRIPHGTPSPAIRALAAKFGVLVNMKRGQSRVPSSYSSSTSTSASTSSFTRKPQPKAFAFLQFATPQQAKKMIKCYAENAPREQPRSRWFFNHGKRRHLGKFRTRTKALIEMRRRRTLRLKRRMEGDLRTKEKVRKWRRKRKILRKVRRREYLMALRSYSIQLQRVREKERKKARKAKKNSMQTEKSSEETAVDTISVEASPNDVTRQMKDPNHQKTTPAIPDEVNNGLEEQEKMQIPDEKKRRSTAEKATPRKLLEIDLEPPNVYYGPEPPPPPAKNERYGELREEYIQLRKKHLVDIGKAQSNEMTAIATRRKRPSAEEKRDAMWSIRIAEELSKN